MSETAEFKVGDVVQLKSGGPKMTIEQIERWHEWDKYLSAKCQWFENNKPHEKVFALHSLQLA